LDGDQLVSRPPPTHRTTYTRNKHKPTSMPRAGFESTNPVFEREKAVNVLDHAATVIGFIAAINIEKYECIYIGPHTRR
jgi:hypothetical protein